MYRVIEANYDNKELLKKNFKATFNREDKGWYVRTLEEAKAANDLLRNENRKAPKKEIKKKIESDVNYDELFRIDDVRFDYKDMLKNNFKSYFNSENKTWYLTSKEDRKEARKMLNYLEDNRHNLMENKWDGEKWYSIWMRARLGEMKWSTEKGEFI